MTDGDDTSPLAITGTLFHVESDVSYTCHRTPHIVPFARLFHATSNRLPRQSTELTSSLWVSSVTPPVLGTTSGGRGALIATES